MPRVRIHKHNTLFICRGKQAIDHTYTDTNTQSKRHHPKPLNQYSWQDKALFNTFDIPPLSQDKYMSLSS